MARDQWIQHIALMLRELSDESLRAVYMVVRALYTSCDQ